MRKTLTIFGLFAGLSIGSMMTSSVAFADSSPTAVLTSERIIAVNGDIERTYVINHANVEIYIGIPGDIWGRVKDTSNPLQNAYDQMFTAYTIEGDKNRLDDLTNKVVPELHGYQLSVSPMYSAHFNQEITSAYEYTQGFLPTWRKYTPAQKNAMFNTKSYPNEYQDIISYANSTKTMNTVVPTSIASSSNKIKLFSDNSKTLVWSLGIVFVFLIGGLTLLSFRKRR